MVSTEEDSGATEAHLLENEIAEVCGILNVATGRLVGLIGQVLATESWAGAGVRSAEQWVTWQCGVSPGRAKTLVAMARRLPDLPVTRAGIEAGELAEDQVAVICRHVPTHNDAAAAELARSATVPQLKRTFNRNTFPKPEPDAKPEPEAHELRRVGFGHDDDGYWRCSAVLPTDEGELVERALEMHRRKLSNDGATNVNWADALLAMAESSLANAAIARPHCDRNLVVIHLETDDENKPGAHVHLGPALPDSLRRYLTCDARVKVQFDAHGTPISVGRAERIVPDRTRLAVEERDGACRVPGCDRTKWLHCHHIVHWERGGPTDTPNLVALCGHHHRLHHRGHLGVSGNADDPDGLTFTDARGRPLVPRTTPVPPSGPPPTGNWAHPTGERLDDACVVFPDPPPATAPTAAEVAAAALAEPVRDYPPFIDLDDPVYGVTDDDDVVGFG